MVNGFEKFKEHFVGYEDCYTIIGGTACDILMNDASANFRLNHMDIHLTPLPVSEEISSLSAIMLDDNYYNLMLKGKKVIGGVSVLDTEYLIVFKIKAYLDLRQKKANGEHVNDRDLRKHKNDVFRLLSIADGTLQITLPGTVYNEVNDFISIVKAEPVNLKNLHLDDFAPETYYRILSSIYISE